MRVGWHHMIILSFMTIISLSRSGTIGQDEVEGITFTFFISVFEANDWINRPRLEPLVEDCDFIGKLKQGSAFWEWVNNLRFSEKWNLQKWEPDGLSTRSNLFVQQL